MKLFYEALPIHELGEFTISQQHEYDSGDAPQRAKVVLTIKVELFEESYTANYDLVRQLSDALLKPQGRLQWTNEEAATDYVKQTVTVVSKSMPEEWGTYQQTVSFVVYFYENLQPDNMPVTFQKTGGSILVRLDNMLEWRPMASSERPSALHSPRRTTQERIAVKALVLGEPQINLARRRDALLAAQKKIFKELASAEGTLKLGVGGKFFNQKVRPEEVSAEIDEANHTIVVSFTAHYLRFPNEADYATVEFNAQQRDPQTGEQFLELTGKITSNIEAQARTKLDQLTSAMATQYGYAQGQLLQSDSVAQQFSGNEDGDAFLELSFTYQWRRWKADNLAATFQKTGNTGSPISLGHVRSFVLGYQASRPNELRSQRTHAAGRVEAAGTFTPADLSLDLSARRASLQAQVDAMMSEVNGADGELIHGSSFDQVVRVENFQASINQKETGIEWTLLAEYSMFPDETGYALSEFSVTPRSAMEDGDEFITMTGRIRAPSKALAAAKLLLLRTSVLTTYGYTIGQQLRTDVTYSSIYANGEKTSGLTEPNSQESMGSGTTFIELAFNEEYRRRRAAGLSYTLRTNRKEDVPSGLVYVTYAGSVTASGNVNAAYTAALAKADAVGRNQEAALGGNAFLRSAQITWDQRQTIDTNDVEFVRLEFQYEYQLKLAAGSSYFELTEETINDPFGQDMTNVQGVIVAVNTAKIDSLYATIKAGYPNRLFRNERTARASATAEKGSAVQLLRLEFTFQIYNLKPTGKTSYRYGLAIERDWLDLRIVSRLHGSVWAPTQANAEAVVAALAASLSLGSLVHENYEASNNFTSDTATLNAQQQPDPTGAFERTDFELTYANRMTGVSGLLEMRLTEEVFYSGPLWVVQNTLKAADGTGGIALPQSVSVQAGGRRVRGEVSAGTLADAEAWAKKQRALLTGDATGVYAQPEQWERDMEFVPRIEGVAIVDPQTPLQAVNVQIWKVRFTFSEILPNYPTPA